MQIKLREEKTENVTKHQTSNYQIMSIKIKLDTHTHTHT